MTPDHSSPLAVSLPYSFNTPSDYPTEVLANRFQAWRSIIKDLINYLKEYASVQEEIVRQQLRLQQAVGTSTSANSPAVSSSSSSNHHNTHKEDLNAINKFFLPIGNGSIQDIPTVLTKFHQQNVTNSSKTLKDINHIIIPKLDELRKDLLVKIKEIKNLQNDFKTNLGKEISETKYLLSQYAQTIEFSNKLDHNPNMSSQHDNDHGKNDPYIVKIKLDRQIKRQLNEENYLYEAYANLQNAGGKLESIIVLEIQNYLSMFLNLLNAENSTISNFLLPNLNSGFLSKEPSFEWDSFISRNLPSLPISLSPLGNNASNIKNGTFIDLSFPARKLSNLSISNFDSPLNLAVREGHLERRSKFLKSYSSGWYVLTSNYLHEFKSSDYKKDPQSVMSLPLDTCTVTDHSKDDGKSRGSYKFILSSKSSNGLIHRSHNWVFRTDSYSGMMDWYIDLKNLTNLTTPSSRANYISKKLKLAPSTSNNQKRTSRTSSILSNRTNGRSIKSITTTSSKNPQSLAANKLRPLSQTTSINNANRLSSTFSHKNNQSPKLSNMINSDGTIITPVDTYQEEKESPLQMLPPQQSQQPQPQQVPLIQQQPGTPQQFIPVNYPQAYYIASSSQNQPQQFYDPIQQQYFTLTPNIPVQGQVQQPQPQYFQSSPQPNSQQQFVSVPAPTQSPKPNLAAGPQLYPINTGNYFSQYPQQLNETSNGEMKLPYPVNVQPPTVNSDKPTNQTATTSEQPAHNGNLNDEVATVQSNKLDGTSVLDADLTKVTISDEK